MGTRRASLGPSRPAAALIRSSARAGAVFRPAPLVIRAIISDDPPLRSMSSGDEDEEPEEVLSPEEELRRLQEEGDKRLQEELLFMLRLGEGRVRITERLDEEGDSMRLRAAKMKMEAEERSKIQLARFSLELGMVSAEIDQKAAEAQEEIKRSRERLKMDERKLSRFEAELARDRNAGLYFKSLHSAGEPHVLTSLEYLHPATVRGMQASKVGTFKAPLRASLYGAFSMVMFGGLCMAIAHGHVGMGVLDLVMLTSMMGSIHHERSQVESAEVQLARIEAAEITAAAERALREIQQRGE